MKMELFVRYDIERLSKYASLAHNVDRISTHLAPTHTSLHFADVNYFNYAVCSDLSQIALIVDQIKSFYKLRAHRLLIEETDQPLPRTFLTQQGYHCKGKQVLLQATDPIHNLRDYPSGTLLESVSPATLYSFTQDYLAGFDSDRADAKPVALNFAQLLSSSTIQLYRVLAHQQPVGIAMLYREGNHFLLAGGAVLPSYRNRGYHTSALISRLRFCWQNQPQSISAWAYQDSVSDQNMRRLGLQPLKSYWIYEYRI